MDVTDSVVALFHQATFGADEVASEFWKRCEGVLRHRAARWVKRLRARGYDTDDLVASAFCLVWQRRCAGDFTDVDSAARLRGLLLKVIDYKVLRRIRSQSRQKRGGGRELHEQSAFAGGESGLAGLQGVQDKRMSELSQQALVTADTLAYLLENADAELRKIVSLRLQGWTLEEIAESVGCCVSTIVRKLRRVEQIWTRMLRDD